MKSNDHGQHSSSTKQHISASASQSQDESQKQGRSQSQVVIAALKELVAAGIELEVAAGKLPQVRSLFCFLFRTVNQSRSLALVSCASSPY